MSSLTETPPCLLLSSNNHQTNCFFITPTMKLQHLNLTAAATTGKKICGSSAGWLIMFDETSQMISLINPFNAAAKIIQLQPIFTKANKPFLVHKVVLLSSDPELDPFNLSVLAIFGEKRELAHYNSRSETWTLLQAAGSNYDDIISHDGNFYAVDEYGKVCEIEGFDLSVKEVFERWFFGGNKVYIVSIDGQLLLVFRYLKDYPEFRYETYKFQVFTLDVEKQKYDMIETFSEFALFLGQNQSTWLPADETRGVFGSCIYFADDHHSRELKDTVINGHDMGLYDMEYNSVMPLQCCVCDPDGLNRTIPTSFGLKTKSLK